jgi:hypothetical protein
MRYIVPLVFVLLLTACNAHTNQVCFNETCFGIELAATPESRARGLMFREHLGDDKGMLFVFDEPGVYNFWMKNTLIPLDIIWIDENRTVINISKNTPPCEADPCPSYGPVQKAKYVLEVNAGKADEIGLKIGDEFIIS